MATPFPSIGLGGIGGTLLGFIVLFIIYLLVIGFVLWLAGEIVVGRRVTFGEALAIAGVGTFLVGASIAFLGLIGLLLGLVIFLLLVKPQLFADLNTTLNPVQGLGAFDSQPGIKRL